MITIIDYKAGNQTSVKRALDYLGIPNQISADPEVIVSAKRLIFPGVGHARSAMEVLRQRHLDSALRQAFKSNIPILGICLGSQIILTRSEEGTTACLDLIPGESRKFQSRHMDYKIPHMGWNAVKFTKEHHLFGGILSGTEFYFVHSYYPQPINPENVYAISDYGIEFPAIVGYRNLIAVQFHAEKSGSFGLRLLANFYNWLPEVNDA